MKKYLWTATAVAALLSTSAYAAEFSCSAPQRIFDQDSTYDTNPVTGIDVSYRPEDHGWRVFHHLANGQIAARAEQYAVTDWSNASKTEWTGTYFKHPNLYMIGQVKRDRNTGNMAYFESLYDKKRGNSLVNQYVAQCAQRYATAPQPAPSQPIVTPAPPPPPPQPIIIQQPPQAPAPPPSAPIVVVSTPVIFPGQQPAAPAATPVQPAAPVATVQPAPTTAAAPQPAPAPALVQPAPVPPAAPPAPVKPSVWPPAPTIPVSQPDPKPIALVPAAVKAVLGGHSAGTPLPSFHSLAENFHSDVSPPMAVTSLDALPLFFGSSDKGGTDQVIVGDLWKCFTMWPNGPAKTETLSDDPSNTVVRLTYNSGVWTKLYLRRSIDGKAAYLYKYVNEDGDAANYTQQKPFVTAVGALLTGCLTGQAMDQPKVWRMLNANN